MGKTLKEIHGPLKQLQLGEPLFVSRDLDAYSLILKMKEKKVESALICESEKLVGIISATDLIKISHRSGEEVNLKKIKIEEVMTADPMTNSIEESVFSCMGKMIVYKFRHLPILDEQGKPYTIITIRDLLYFLSDRLVYDDSALGEIYELGDRIVLQENIPDIENANYDTGIFSKNLSRINTPRLTTADIQSSTYDLVMAMLSNKSPSALITEWDTKIRGIITFKDVLFKCVANHSNYNPHNFFAFDYATQNPSFLMYYQWVGHALKSMIEGNFRNVPVVNEDKEALKIVDLGTILSYLYFEIKDRQIE